MSVVVWWGDVVWCARHAQRVRSVSDFAVCFPWQAGDCQRRSCSPMASHQFRVAAGRMATDRMAIDREAARHWGRQAAVSWQALFGHHLFGVDLFGDPTLRDLSGVREVVPSAVSAEVLVGPWRRRCRSSA